MNNYFDIYHYSDNYLAHHGIKGQKYSGFNTKTPTIFFGKNVKYNWTASNLSEEQVNKAKEFIMKKDAQAAMLKETTKTLGKSYLAGLGVLTGSTVAADAKLKIDSKKKQKNQNGK